MYCYYSAEVWKNADKNWKYSRTYYQVNRNASFTAFDEMFHS